MLRVFKLAAGASVNLSGLTICNGHARDGAAGTNSMTPGWPGDHGGGIYSSGTLALTNCVITRCRSGQGGAGFATSALCPPGNAGSSDGGQGGNGGGIYNAGTLTLTALPSVPTPMEPGAAAGIPDWLLIPVERAEAEAVAVRCMARGLPRSSRALSVTTALEPGVLEEYGGDGDVGQATGLPVARAVSAAPVAAFTAKPTPFLGLAAWEHCGPGSARRFGWSGRHFILRKGSRG